MATIDLADVSVRDANELLRQFGEAGEDVDVVNPDARHHIGVGLTAAITVRVHGSAGYFCAGLTDGPRFEIQGNVGWGLADNMLSGSVVVHGNASAIAGVAIRGAEVVVRGNIGSRAGQVMKGGSTLCCAGNASFMAGYMMYGGRLIVCGDSGDRVGQDIHGGTIYVGGRIESVGVDAELVELPSDEEDDVLAFLDRYEIPFAGRFQKIVNAGKNLHYARTEPRVRVMPFFVGSQRTDYWNAKVQEDIAVKAQIGRYRIRGYGAGRPLPHLSDIAFKHDLATIEPDPDVVGRVELATSLGGRFGAVPIDLSMPVMIAPMSYGALSKSTKIALAKASALSDICDNTGEGGLIPEVRAAARRVVVQCLGGRLGWNAHVMRQADGVEIYISQGAKPGLGGQLMAKKVTPDIARLRGIPAGIDLRSPSRHPDVLGADDLVIKVEEFREATGWQKPVSVKLGAGRVRDDIKIAYKDGFDYVCLDGVQGSTGAAGNEVLEYVGIPTLSAIMEGLDALAEIGATGMPVVLMGGVKDGIDTAKALALGAHAVAVGTSAIIAGGCIACLQCHVGQCVVGIATQDPEHEKRYDIESESWNIHRYLEALRWQLASVVSAHGYTNVYELSRDDLVALTPEAAEITRLPYAPEYVERRELLPRAVDMATDAFTSPPEPDVYGPDRVVPPPLPPELAPQDDVDDTHFVPAPCQVACPIGTDAPSYLAYIWEDKLEEAFEAITATNPFSSVCGRVCDAPCEPACRRADSDGPIAIRNLKRYVMDRLGATHRLPPVPVTRAQSVGIVGGGPAGLTAAQDLAEAGYVVHVYELTHQLGGYMTWGIPAFRCPQEVFREDIDRMLARCPGITVQLETALGLDITLDELKERHDAVLLTIGAWWAKDMVIEHADDPRVVDGVSFLRKVNAGARMELPRRVVVVGAGDVAMDACRAALRLPGCEEVQVLYRRGPEEIPARKDELHGAIEEGVEIVYNVQPRGVHEVDDRFVLRCVRTGLGEPGADGRRRPVELEGTEHDYDCGLVIMAIGQRTESEHLEQRGLMGYEKVHTDWSSMRTADPKVFAAGDGAFGPSTIVMAMHHGHRAAYYLQKFLEGVEQPLPYRTPFKTRRVPVSQDPEWEEFARQHQAFHGLGANPIAFPEIESTYDPEAARREAARCLRCDAETGSSDYNVRTREDIFVMARTRPADAPKQRAVFTRRLKVSNQAHFNPQRASLDDLVFLPANLSRLVIDPYRDACRVTTPLAPGLELAAPFLVGGLDAAAEQIRTAAGHAVRECGLASVGRLPLAEDAPWLQLVVPGEDQPDERAVAVITAFRDGFRPVVPERRREGQALGIASSRADLPTAIPFALEHELDLLLLEANPPIAGPWPELAGAPDLAVVRDAVRIMRSLNREEDLALLFAGGVRTGTDAAKLVGLGANAVVVGLALALAIGGQIEDGQVAFYGDAADDDRAERARLFLSALRAEASIMPRCTGKTDIHNLEPEDLRSISLATAEATGLPLAGRNVRLAGLEVP